MVHINKYFCFELITAGLIIGWVGLMNSTISSVSIITMLSDPDHYFNSTNTSVLDPSLIDPQFSRTALINILATSLGFGIINMLASALLIVGTVKKNHLMLIPWLINNGFSLLYGALIVSALSIYFIVSDQEVVNILLFLAVGSLTIIFTFYTWAAIYSLYRKFKAELIIGENQRLLQQQKNYNTDYKC